MSHSIELPARMPSSRRESTILAPNGKPVSYWLYPSPRTNLKAYKPRYWLSADTKSNVSSYDRWELVNYSRQLFAQIDVLHTSVDQKNNWAFGDAWDAHYFGANEAWGEEASVWLRDVWFPNANVRGPQYDFKRSLKISGMSWDVDGDDAMVLTETANGFPQVAFFPSTKIASGGGAMRGGSLDPSNTVDGGPYDGAKIFDGIIYDRNCRPIALRIVGEDGKSADISTYNADLAYEPTWHDQGRGIPKIATSLLQWMSLQDVQGFILAGVKRASQVGLLMKNAEGEANDPNLITEELKPGESEGGKAVAYNEIEGTEDYYLSSSDGEEITPLNYKNPHPNTEEFIRRVTQGALASVGWHLELIDLKSSGRAPSRILCDLANQSIWARQTTGHRRWKRAIGYAIAKGMKNGYIPKNEDGADPYMWEPGLPKPLQVDAGNDAQADRESMKLGTTNKALLSQKNHGVHYRDIDRQRARELRETIEAAEQLSAEHPWLTKDRALELLEQRSPNPIMQQAAKPAAAPAKGAA